MAVITPRIKKRIELKLLADQNYTNSAIARILGISPNTVKKWRISTEFMMQLAPHDQQR